MNEYFQNYIENGYHFYFVSPHIDDAALSCGALIDFLSKVAKVTVVNVFTKGGSKPYTLSAKALLSRCGFNNADNFFEERLKEDKEAYHDLGIETVNLNFVDVPWRKKPNTGKIKNIMGRIIPEAVHSYPVYRQVIEKGIVSKFDEEVITEIEKALVSLIDGEKSVVFCPRSVSVHTDHTIVNTVCSKLFKNIVYWSDFPYSLKHEPTVNQEFNTYTYLGSYEGKRKMILSYKSQIRLLFADGKIPDIPEKYYYKLPATAEFKTGSETRL